MNESPRATNYVRVLVGLTMVLCITATMVGAHGQDKNAGGMRVATVDLQALQNGYKQIAAFQKEVGSKSDTLKLELQTWSQNPLLSPQEQATLVQLKTKENSPNGLSNAEKEQKKKLEDQSAAVNNEYSTLQQTAVGVITPAQKTRLETLIRIGTENDARISSHKQEVEDAVRKDGLALAETAQKSMREALARIAKEKGYTLVLSSEIAPYATDDVTPDVLKQLNK